MAKKYILSFWNAVNMRFSSFTRPSISLSLAGILVSTSRSATPYLKANTINATVVNAVTALDDMGKYFYKPVEKLPVHDMVVALTGLDMCSSGCNHTHTAGYAYIGGGCVRNR